MKCSTFSAAIGWNCAAVGTNALLVHAPMTLGRDGEHASYYLLEPEPGRFYLTDAHQALMHASDHNAKPSKARIERLAAITPTSGGASLMPDGEIVAEGESKDLQRALWDALRLTIAISNNEQAWLPRMQHERFAQHVWRKLHAKLADGALVSKPRFTGLSGHQFEFPLGVRLPDGKMIRAIQPIAISEDRRVDWGYVYQSFGKLADLKKATVAGVENRLVVMEPGAPLEDYAKVVSMLSEVARVITLKDDSSLISAAVG